MQSLTDDWLRFSPTHAPSPARDDGKKKRRGKSAPSGAAVVDSDEEDQKGPRTEHLGCSLNFSEFPKEENQLVFIDLP